MAERERLFAPRSPFGPPCRRYPRLVAVTVTDPDPLEFMSRLAEREGLFAAAHPSLTLGTAVA
jgi:hypothetical protein